MMTEYQLNLAMVCATAALAFGQVVRADDGGLYEKPIDPNSAFVRVIAPGSAGATVKSNSFSHLNDGVSPYVAVAPGDIAVSSSFREANVAADAGKFYTAVLTESGVVTLEDAMTKNPAKATLTLYNLTEKADLDLFVPQASAKAISDVDSGASKSVALKAPLKVDLVVRQGDKDIARIDKVEFKRLAGVTIVVTGSGDDVSAVAVPSTIAR